MEECVECGGAVFGDGLYCEDCDIVFYEDLECSLCGRRFNTEDGGEYDTCGPCLEELEDAA